MNFEEHYTEGRWGGRPNYKCKHCAFASLEEANLPEHIQKFHVLACDSAGCGFTTTNPIEAREHAEREHPDPNTTIILTDSYGRELFKRRPAEEER